MDEELFDDTIIFQCISFALGRWPGLGQTDGSIGGWGSMGKVARHDGSCEEFGLGVFTLLVFITKIPPYTWLFRIPHTIFQVNKVRLVIKWRLI